MPLKRRVFDAHADTAVLDSLDGKTNNLRLSDIYDFDGYMQVFAVCAEYFDPAFEYSTAVINRFTENIKGEKIKLVRRSSDLFKPYGAVLALEGADAVKDSSALDFFYDRGVRLITLVWNRENHIASNCFSEKDEGLKPFGRELIGLMEKKNMVIDLSHMGDRGFYEACEKAKGPVILSHSNSKKVFDNPRNITDDMFQKVAKKGGCVGVNFEPLFGAGDIDKIIGHIEHFCAIDKTAVGIGTDFDGISRLPDKIGGAKDILKLGEELLRLNYKESDVEGILFDNFFRVFHKILSKTIA